MYFELFFSAPMPALILLQPYLVLRANSMVLQLCPFCWEAEERHCDRNSQLGLWFLQPPLHFLKPASGGV